MASHDHPLRPFPILGPKGDVDYVPWGLVERHAVQVDKNHYQTTEQLVERGGLTMLELAAVLLDRPLGSVRGMTHKWASERVLHAVAAYIAEGPYGTPQSPVEAVLETVRQLSAEDVLRLRKAVNAIGVTDPWEPWRGDDRKSFERRCVGEKGSRSPAAWYGPHSLSAKWWAIVYDADLNETSAIVDSPEAARAWCDATLLERGFRMLPKKGADS